MTPPIDDPNRVWIVLANLDNLQVCLDFSEIDETDRMRVTYDASTTTFTDEQIHAELNKMIDDVLR